MGQQSGLVLKLGPGKYPPIRWLGPGKVGNTDWALQEGIIFGWSESNVRYESAWWLEADGTPATGTTVNHQNHINALCEQRPFDPKWIAH